MANGKDGTATREPEPMPGAQDLSLPGELLATGRALQKMGTPFVTAIAVQRPRNMDKVVEALDRECEYGGESFYYSMPFGGQRVEGGSIGLAQSIVREWGNVAVTCNVEENDDSWIFTARFIDLEKGVQIERAFRQRKGGQVHGKFDPERKLDIAFQIGQSKALRNVIFNGVPRWLSDRCIDKAKQAVANKITPEGLEKAKDQAIATFKTFKVTEEMLITKIGKPKAEWTTRDLADLRGDYAAIKNGEMSAAELFPPADPKAPPGPVNEASTAGGTLKSEPREPGQDEGEGGWKPTPEEARAIKEREAREAAQAGGTPPPPTQSPPGAPGKKEPPSKGGLFK